MSSLGGVEDYRPERRQGGGQFKIKKKKQTAGRMKLNVPSGEGKGRR